MGVFFERQADPAITQMLRTALTAEPPADAEQGRSMSVQMAGQLQPVVNAVSKPWRPRPVAGCRRRSGERQRRRPHQPAPRRAKFNTGRFLVALVIFLLLLAADHHGRPEADQFVHHPLCALDDHLWCHRRLPGREKS